MAKPDQSIHEHTQGLKEQANTLKKLGCISNDNLYKDLLTACEYHDYGKANSEFQKRIKFHYRFNKNEEVPHSVLSLFFVNSDECIDYISVCFAVLYHHYHCDSPVDIFYDEEELIKKFLNEMLGNSDVYDEMYDCIDEIGDLFLLNENDAKKKFAVLLKGFLHKCDYSASAGITCEYRNDFLCESLQNWKQQNSVTYNQLQKFCIQNTNKDVIITAPTGMGKTEAGLLWCGDNKCFFILPLKTAINAMYQRIKDLASDDYKSRVAILHSDIRQYYLNDGAVNASGEFDFDYCVRSRQMSLPVTVCTPDQIFDFVLKYAGYEYKLATASYSKFIIDEIQMYSPDLLAAIIYAIKTIHNMGGKFAILTATLPPFVRSELIKIFGTDVVQKDFSQFGTTRHNVKVYDKALDAQDVFEQIQNCASAKKYLVVCNSIDTANKVFNDLKCLCDSDIDVNLFHANFIKKDRAKKEKQILNASNDTTKTEIWVSTSVVEASLDIDFDLLFTELSDLFSLFQRFGRVNRKGKKDCTQTNCYVYTQLQGNAKRYKFTDETIYELSKNAISTVDGIITETQKSQLIEEYLSVDNLANSKYVRQYNEAFKYLEGLYDYEKDSSEQLRSIDTVDAIPVDVYNEFCDDITNAINVLSSQQTKNEDKLKLIEFIKSLTVSVSKYKAKKAIKYIYPKHLSIPILAHCSYSFENGIVFEKSSNKGNNYSFLEV